MDSKLVLFIGLVISQANYTTFAAVSSQPLFLTYGLSPPTTTTINTTTTYTTISFSLHYCCRCYYDQQNILIIVIIIITFTFTHV